MKPYHTIQCVLFFVVALCSPSIGSARSTSDKIKDKINDVAKSMKDEVDQLGNDLNALQNYLDHYDWKGMIQGKATSGVATLSDFRMNEHHRVVAVRPGQTIYADVVCDFDPEKCSAIEIYKVVVGYKGVGPQAVACTCLGIAAGKKVEKFHMKAPLEPGFYEVRFRTVSRVLECDAFSEWKDENGLEPDASTTIGVVWVKA